MTIDWHKLANRVFSHRDLAGLTQEQLAELAGCGRTDIINLENCRKPPSLVRFVRIAAALGVDPGELLREVSDE